jgi:hypothetical protein
MKTWNTSWKTTARTEASGGHDDSPWSAGGSIGTFGVQIAKALGAEVTAVDSAIKEEMLRRIGADHFIDYAEEDFTRGGPVYDVIFSMVAKTPYAACFKALKPGGRYLMANPKLSGMLRSVLTPKRAGKTAVFAFARETPEELLALKEKSRRKTQGCPPCPWCSVPPVAYRVHRTTEPALGRLQPSPRHPEHAAPQGNRRPHEHPHGNP